MRGQSHISLGNYLLEQFMPQLPGHFRRAFLLGCIEPDRNPATYLKGSLRFQWLRGHNYRNAHRFMRRISRRLEQKKDFHLFDYYTLGKLIHYTADAFTFAHNDSFSKNLSLHREYEESLQNHFLSYLRTAPQIEVRFDKSIMEAIENHHREYSRNDPNIHRDSRFALQACCCVLAMLLTPRVI